MGTIWNSQPGSAEVIAPPSVLKVLLIASIPVGAALIGATVAALRPPGLVVRSSIQHFAAGVIFSVVAVELLPEIRKGHDPFDVGWTFAAGVAPMLLIDRLVKRYGHAKASGPSPGQLVPIGVDLLLDGLLIGIAMTAGLKQGVLLTVALTLEPPQH